MSDETVKVEVELPKNVYEAIDKVCKRFGEDFSEVVAYEVKGGLEASANGHFEAYAPEKQVPLMVKTSTSVYLNWWHKVASRRIPGLPLDDFLMEAGRRYMDFDSKKWKITEQERRSLNQFLFETQITAQEQFAEEINKLLEEKP